MAANAPSSLRSSLERLKNAGAVNGILLGWRRHVLINALPFEKFRAERLLQEAHDTREHFASGGDRQVDTLWFGYDTVHVLVVFWQETTLILLHTRAEEADFLRRAAQTCLEDGQLLIEGLLHPAADSGAEGSAANEDEDARQITGKTNFLGVVS
jgi:hypothetical protein